MGDSDKENMKKMVATNLRSVTQSAKGGVPYERLQKEYRTLLGSSIPFRELGYSNLDDMIRAMPDVVRFSRNEIGETTVIGVADETTAHIVSLVSRQKAVKPKRMPVSQRGRFRVPTGRRMPTVQTNRWVQLPKPSIPRREVVQKPFTSPPKPQAVKPKKEPPFQQHRESVPFRPSTYETPPRFRKKSSQELPEDPHPPPATREPEVQQLQPPVLEPRLPRPLSPRLSEPVIPPPTYRNVPTYVNRTLSLPVGDPNELQEHLYAGGDAGRPIQAIRSPKEKKKKKRAKLPVAPLPDNLPAKLLVEEYAKRHDLVISYQTRPIGQKRRMYISTLTLGEKTYKSFPNERATESEAEEEAAIKAAKAIKDQESQTPLEETPCDTPEELKIMLCRIEEIIAEKTNAMWSMGIIKEYEKRHNETLPSDWVEIVKTNLCGTIDVEMAEDMNINAQPGACIMQMKSSGTVTPTSSSSRASNPLDDELAASRISNQLSNVSLQEGSPPGLDLPTDSTWSVFVTYVSSTVDIAVQLIDHMEELTEMSEKMISYYTTHRSTIKLAEVGKLYAAHIIDEDQQSCWHRVYVMELLPSRVGVKCYSVDVGNTLDVPVSELQELAPVFQVLPFQAINIQLFGLEDYSGIVKFEHLDRYLFNQSRIAEINSRNDNIIQATLYDTSTDVDINLNKLLKQLTFDESLRPILPEVGSTAICFLTSVAIGEVFLRIGDPNVNLLDAEIEKLSPNFEDCVLKKPLSKLSPEKVYVAKYSNGMWYRAMLHEVCQDNPTEVEIYYIDYGNTTRVSLSNICELEPISDLLAGLPNQAIPVTLNGVPPGPNLVWTENALYKLEDLAENADLIVKVEQPAVNQCPAVVSLFRRNEDMHLISINQTLAFSRELFRRESSPTMSSMCDGLKPTKPSSLGVQQTLHNTAPALSSYIPDVAVPAAVFEGQLSRQQIAMGNVQPNLLTPTPDSVDVAQDLVPEAEVPVLNEPFAIFIVFTASPSNMIVQSKKHFQALNALVDEMQQYYSVEDNTCEMHLCLLKEGSFYAARYADGMWYRAKLKYINNRTDEVRVGVYYVDYGNLDEVPMSELQPLWRKFKTLPCQAMKAALLGVKPHESDWSIEEICDFRNLVTEKWFICVVKRIRTDPDFDGHTLDVVLVDTSQPDEDVYIDKLMISQNLALPCSDLLVSH